MMYQSTIHSKAKKQLGMAMVETLVSLFLLAVGLLGSLAMQVKGINSNQRAQFTTDANIIAEDMANRILGYMRNLDLSNAMDSSKFDDFNGINSRSTQVSNPDCLSTGCSLAQQRVFDEWQWTNEVKSRLPDGVGIVSYASGTYKVTVMWNHNQIENPTFNCAGAETDLACFVYQLKID